MKVASLFTTNSFIHVIENEKNHCGLLLIIFEANLILTNNEIIHDLRK